MFVAFMLVIQAFFSGLSLGAMASPQQVDALGRVICAIDGIKTSDQAPTGTPNQHHLDCCTLGCSMVGATVPVMPDAYLDLQAASAAVRSPAIFSALLRPRAELSPQNPRGPPGAS